MRTLLLFVLAALALVAGVVPGARAQTAPAAVAAAELTPAERALVEGSRAAIIETGLTEAYFNEHFRLARVLDRPGDRRVVWKLSVNGYVTTVNDSVGFYTEGARRVDTHSVGTLLPSTSDITRTITRRRAEAVMRRCIGKFTNPQVEYRAHGTDGHAALLLTAQSTVPRQREGHEARERREREERERRERARAQQSGGTPQVDEVESEDEEGEGPVIVLGAVDLVTGECSVGYGQSGPSPPKPARPRASHR